MTDGDPDNVKSFKENPAAANGDLNDVHGNILWGTKDIINQIIEFSDDWQKSGHDDVVEVGDISFWCGGTCRHSGHQDGLGVDIRSNTAGKLDNAGYKNDKEKAVEFAVLAYSSGFGRIIHMCPHVTRVANDATEAKFVIHFKGHQHHFHFDLWNKGDYTTDIKANYYCLSCVHKDGCSSAHKQPPKENN